MASAFAAARRQLSPTASAVILDNQRGWLDYVERACTENAEPMTTGRYDEDGTQCLITIFNRRVAALGEIGSVGDKVFYSVDAFDAAPDPDPESWSSVAISEISFAQMDGDSAEARAFNAYSYDLAANALDPVLTEGLDGTTDTVTAITVNAVLPGLIGLRIDDYFYGHGAAHGNYAITYGTFLRDDMRPLRADDVFAGGDWAKELTPLVIDRLIAATEAETGDVNVLWEDLTGLDQSIADPQRWGHSGRRYRLPVPALRGRGLCLWRAQGTDDLGRAAPLAGAGRAPDARRKMRFAGARF